MDGCLQVYSLVVPQADDLSHGPSRAVEVKHDNCGTKAEEVAKLGYNLDPAGGLVMEVDGDWVELALLRLDGALVVGVGLHLQVLVFHDLVPVGIPLGLITLVVLAYLINVNHSAKTCRLTRSAIPPHDNYSWNMKVHLVLLLVLVSVAHILRDLSVPLVAPSVLFEGVDPEIDPQDLHLLLLTLGVLPPLLPYDPLHRYIHGVV